MLAVHRPRRSARRVSLAVLTGAGLLAVAAAALPSAWAAPARDVRDVNVAQRVDGEPRSVVTSGRLTVSVTPTRRLDPAGAVVRVRGAGFDPTVGIYVALCVTPRAGQQPSPCGGGVNTTGRNPASAWISSNPPPYGSSLAIPYRPGGRFSVKLEVSALIGDVDCRVVSCSIVTRADHTRAGDRRFDVAVPVTFR